jgi:titin
VKLAWQPPTSNGSSALTGYDVYRRTATGAYALVKSLTPDRLTWRDQTTTSGTVYSYVVKAKNAAGSSAPSNEAGATAR